MKTVLVTGGSKGIGRAICEIFLNKGYNVAFCYSKDDKAAKEFLATSDKLRCYKVDVSVKTR